MSAYYNEIDPFAAAWLRELIKGGWIADGEVDERSIVEVSPDDLRGFTQCHFFAGIGGWSYALRLAGWDDSRPVWTGSCPCQPFSSAGKRKGKEDERHLWPHFFGLIRECRPVACFGEQVASRDALAWLDHVCNDLEGEGYAVGAVDSCAAGYGAPHIRQRIYWMAHDDEAGRGLERLNRLRQDGHASTGTDPHGRGEAFVLGDSHDKGLPQQRGEPRTSRKAGVTSEGEAVERAGAPTNGLWANADWIACRDGKARPVESGTFPLAHGIPARVGRLRGYGNAIVAPQAAEFIKAFRGVIE